MRKTGSSAGVGEAVFAEGTLFVPVVALSPPTPSPVPVVLVLDRASGGGLDLRGSFGGVFSFSFRLCLSAPSNSPFVLALVKGLAFCISRCTTSSAILGEGGDGGGGGGAVAFLSWTILFSTGSYRCSLRDVKGRVNFGSALIDRYFRPSPLKSEPIEPNGHLLSPWVLQNVVIESGVAADGLYRVVHLVG